MEINLKEKYLPVGTVVLLKGGKKRVMITGFCVVSPEVEKKIFDYCGCIYPEGYLNSTQNCLFNHDQIDKIYHVGLVDDEELKFKNQLKSLAPTIDAQFAEFVKDYEKKENVQTENASVNNVQSNNTANINVSPVNTNNATQSDVALIMTQHCVALVVETPVVDEPAVKPTAQAAEPAVQPVNQPEAQPSVINFLDESQK